MTAINFQLALDLNANQGFQRWKHLHTCKYIHICVYVFTCRLFSALNMQSQMSRHKSGYENWIIKWCETSACWAAAKDKTCIPLTLRDN